MKIALILNRQGVQHKQHALCTCDCAACIIWTPSIVLASKHYSCKGHAKCDLKVNCTFSDSWLIQIISQIVTTQNECNENVHVYEWMHKESIIQSSNSWK